MHSWVNVISIIRFLSMKYLAYHLRVEFLVEFVNLSPVLHVTNANKGDSFFSIFFALTTIETYIFEHVF